MSNVWRLITHGRFQDACSAADEEYESSGRHSALRNKVFALLKLGRYNDVIDLCRLLVEKTSGDTVDDFMDQGIAHWLNNERESAMGCWAAAQKAHFQDAAGGVACRLLLWYGALRTGDSKLMLRIEKWLRKKFEKAPMVWPAPLAGLVCGELDEDELVASFSQNAVLAERQLCQAAFYLGLRAMQDGDFVQLSNWMHKAISLTSVTWLESEYYLATGEVREIDGNGECEVGH
jgi:hypothetical protein